MSAYSAAVLADSPYVYWRLDETSGTTLADSSGNARGGTLSSSMPPGSTASLLSADADTCITFDYTTTLGPNRAVGASGSGISTTPMTVEFWIKPVDLTNGGSVAVCVDCALAFQGWSAYYTTSGVWHLVYQGSTDATFTATASAGVAQHVVFLCTSSAVDLYINGAFQQSVSVSAMVSTPNVLTIGAQYDFDHDSKAAIDEVALYATTLSAARILAHYNAASTAAVSQRMALTGVGA